MNKTLKEAAFDHVMFLDYKKKSSDIFIVIIFSPPASCYGMAPVFYCGVHGPGGLHVRTLGQNLSFVYVLFSKK